MNASVNAILFDAFVLFVLPWIVVFGGSSALLANARGGSWPVGLLWGICIGPFGWIAVFFTTRGSQRDTYRRSEPRPRADRAEEPPSPRRGKFL